MERVPERAACGLCAQLPDQGTERGAPRFNPDAQLLPQDLFDQMREEIELLDELGGELDLEALRCLPAPPSAREAALPARRELCLLTPRAAAAPAS